VELGGALVRLVLGSTILLVMALAAERLMRRRPGALRHLLLFLAIAALLPLPTGGLLLPRIVVALPMAAGGFDPGIPAGLRATAKSSADPAIFLVFGLWMAGFLLFLCRMAAARIRFRRAVAAATPADPARRRHLDGLLRDLGIRRRVTLWTCEKVETPIVAGFLNPRILLPLEAAEWSGERHRVVLEHELAHVRRFDALTLMLAQVAVAWCWFNPLAWLALRRMRLACEQACDDLVLAQGAKPSVYASHLLALVTEAGGARWAAALPVAGEFGIEKRLIALLDPSHVSRRPSRPMIALSAGGVAAFAIPLAVLQPTALSPPAFVAPRASAGLRAAAPGLNRLDPVPASEGAAPAVARRGWRRRPSRRKTDIPIAPVLPPSEPVSSSSSSYSAGARTGSGQGYGYGAGSGAGTGRSGLDASTAAPGDIPQG
jgi:beta-lactamase regulating signal transducer with metallopeptidase domain